MNPLFDLRYHLLHLLSFSSPQDASSDPTSLLALTGNHLGPATRPSLRRNGRCGKDTSARKQSNHQCWNREIPFLGNRWACDIHLESFWLAGSSLQDQQNRRELDRVWRIGQRIRGAGLNLGNFSPPQSCGKRLHMCVAITHVYLLETVLRKVTPRSTHSFQIAYGWQWFCPNWWKCHRGLPK